MAQTETCESCGKEMEIADWPFCPHGATRQRWAADWRTVVFRDKSGRIRVPGRADTPTPLGYERLEITSRREADRVCRELNARDRECFEQNRARQEEVFGRQARAGRESLRRDLDRFDAWGRELALAAIRAGEERERREARYEPGNHIEALEYDSSSRERHFDPAFLRPHERSRR